MNATFTQNEGNTLDRHRAHSLQLCTPGGVAFVQQSRHMQDLLPNILSQYPNDARRAENRSAPVKRRMHQS